MGQSVVFKHLRTYGNKFVMGVKLDVVLVF